MAHDLQVTLGRDFVAWVQATFTAGEPHALFPGRHLKVGVNEYPTILTAEQAEYLARHILAVAEGAQPPAVG